MVVHTHTVQNTRYPQRSSHRELALAVTASARWTVQSMCKSLSATSGAQLVLFLRTPAAEPPKTLL